MHYIFGYGSLICQDSRSRTGTSSKAYAIEVKGISRNWSVHTPDWPATAVSVTQKQSSHCTGVYFEVDEANLKQFDRREQGYNRVQIPWESVAPSCTQPLPESGNLWVYVGKNNNVTPLPERPIMQSYLDVILNGCLDFSEHFAARFLQLTGHWQHLIDDRSNPQYVRPLNSTHRLELIDKLIAENQPELWTERKPLEPK
ncbi:gamma-glutamylcyclotransferase family protein [Reinekea marina]|uniref:Gamma-glutamylcyclotransferase family protein n=1 Tax=Reinekea marina TaxID=1310421 RepID=A0ABV7WQK1_9GAMM|nr:gamma-glutamylcyclotransferase family protein [Reinekea marina]MBU2863025.1 gamma-glutamylcyclotransferase [Reinekea forsetii]MDN3650292.1 gamma-glutamylcyclotransferase family protein [Reinekea marina]MDN3651096.1 gamma-glutamylcyclotransferase family protein [Reinekea marina]